MAEREKAVAAAVGVALSSNSRECSELTQYCQLALDYPHSRTYNPRVPVTAGTSQVKKKFEELDAKLVPELEKLDADIAAATSAGEHRVIFGDCVPLCSGNLFLGHASSTAQPHPLHFPHCTAIKTFLDAQRAFATVTVRVFEESLAATESPAGMEAASAPPAEPSA